MGGARVQPRKKGQRPKGGRGGTSWRAARASPGCAGRQRRGLASPALTLWTLRLYLGVHTTEEAVGLIEGAWRGEGGWQGGGERGRGRCRGRAVALVRSLSCVSRLRRAGEGSATSGRGAAARGGEADGGVGGRRGAWGAAVRTARQTRCGRAEGLPVFRMRAAHCPAPSQSQPCPIFSPPPARGLFRGRTR